MFVKGHKNPENLISQKYACFQSAAKLNENRHIFLFTPVFIITYLHDYVNKKSSKTKIFFSKVLTLTEFSVDMGGKYGIVTWFFS